MKPWLNLVICVILVWTTVPGGPPFNTFDLIKMVILGFNLCMLVTTPIYKTMRNIESIQTMIIGDLIFKLKKHEPNFDGHKILEKIYDIGGDNKPRKSRKAHRENK